MADISKEIDDFLDAEYGDQVRNSMVSLCIKVNDEVEQDTEKVSSYTELIESSLNEIDKMIIDVQSVQTENIKINKEAIKSASNAKISEEITEEAAKASQSYAIGGTDFRPEEATDNAKYYYESTKSIENECKNSAAEAKDLVRYATAQIAGWDFFINPDDANLYVETDNTVTEFSVDSDGYLCVEV